MGKSTISMAILPEGIHITNITTLRPTIWNFTHSIPTVYIPRCSSIFSRDPQSFFQLRGLHGVEPAVVSGTSKTDENCAWHGGASGASGQICDDLSETNQKTQRIPNFSILFFPPTWPHPPLCKTEARITKTQSLRCLRWTSTAPWICGVGPLHKWNPCE